MLEKLAERGAVQIVGIVVGFENGYGCGDDGGGGGLAVVSKSLDRERRRSRHERSPSPHRRHRRRRGSQTQRLRPVAGFRSPHRRRRPSMCPVDEQGIGLTSLDFGRQVQCNYPNGDIQQLVCLVAFQWNQ